MQGYYQLKQGKHEHRMCICTK